MIDFKEIPEANKATGNQDRFEFFARDFLAELSYEIIEEPNRGSDGGTGSDMIVEETRTGPGGETKIKWFVSCKHKAHSGKSVVRSDDPDILDRVNAKSCDGFIGFYSTVISTGLSSVLEGLRGKTGVFTYCPNNIEIILTKRSEMANVFARYFPKSYKSWKDTHVFDSELFDPTNIPSFTQITKPQNKNFNADRFYDGFPPTVEDLNADFDIQRDAYTKKNGLKQKLEEQFKKRDSYPKIFLIKGVGGAGKTSLLRRIAFDLSKIKGHLFYLNRDWHCDSITVQTQIKTIIEEFKESIFIFIDDFSDLINHEALDLQAIIEICNTTNLFFIIADHPNKWNQVLHKLKSLDDGHNFFPSTLYQLSNKECERLADKMISLENSGQLTIRHRMLTKEDRIQICTEDSRRHFVVSMFQIRYGRNFENIIIGEYENLTTMTDGVQKAYEIICLFNRIGLSIPENLLLKACFWDTYSGAKDLQKYLVAMLDHHKDGYSARHPFIARVIFSHVFTSSHLRALALHLVFSKINLKESDDLLFISQFLRSINIHKKLVRLLDKKEEFVRHFLTTLKSVTSASSKKFRIQLLIFFAMCERILGNHQRALEIFLEVVNNYNPEHPFVIRQIAWINHDLTNWTQAADWAVKSAEVFSESLEHQIQTARILSLNTVENFQLAKNYFDRAKLLNPSDPEIEKSYQNYLNAEKALNYFSSLYEDEMIPDHILKMLRPGLSFFKSYYGINTREYNRKLTEVLSRMEEQFTGSVADLNELVEKVNLNNNKIMKSKYLCNLGRVMYLEWYHNQRLFETKEIENIFRKSLILNIHDPFCHCWLGTYYKEVEKNYDKAEVEYRDAIHRAKNSKYNYENNHPLFENNLGLLFLDKVRFLNASPELLIEAKNYFENAVNNNKIHSSDFYWAEYNLELCYQLLEE